MGQEAATLPKASRKQRHWFGTLKTERSKLFLGGTFQNMEAVSQRLLGKIIPEKCNNSNLKVSVARKVERI